VSDPWLGAAAADGDPAEAEGLASGVDVDAANPDGTGDRDGKVRAVDGLWRPFSTNAQMPAPANAIAIRPPPVIRAIRLRDRVREARRRINWLLSG